MQHPKRAAFGPRLPLKFDEDPGVSIENAGSSALNLV